MNVTDIAKKIIKEEIEKSGFNVVQIILFGSRAKGDFNKESDWDFLVVVDKEINRNLKRKFFENISIKLAQSNILNDIIIKSIKDISEQKDDKGYLAYYAIRDGILI